MSKQKLILRPTAYKMILYALICAGFMAISFFLLKERPGLGWFSIILFGSGLVIFIMQLIPGASQLELNEEGFIITSLYRSNMTRWSDVKVFKQGYLGRSKAVMFDYVYSHKKASTMKSISKEISGSHGALPDTYGMKAEELLELMNSWKERYGRVGEE